MPGAAVSSETAVSAHARPTSRALTPWPRLGGTWLVLALGATLLAGCSRAEPAVQAATSTPTAEAAVNPVALRAPLQALLASGRHPALRWPRFRDQRTELTRLYDRSAWQPLWLSGGRPTLAATGLIARLAAADSLGLEPADYDPAWLAGQAAELNAARGAAGAEAQAGFEVGLSVAAVRFVSALHRGRVSPRLVHAALFLARPQLAIEMVVDSLRDAAAQGSLLTRLQPQLEHYQFLKNGLAHYRALATDSTLVPLPAMPRVVKPGMRLRSAARLRHLLAATGDLSASAAIATAADSVYGAELVAGVKNFQRRQGFDADGVIGRATVARLNRPFAQRVRQIELVLERFRWLPKTFSAPPVVVNIPAFRLYTFLSAVDRERDMLAMDVVVGGSFDRRTPVFAADMKYLIFRPFWEVPQSIMDAEIRPKAQRDPDYLEREHMVLVSDESERAPALPATAANIARIGRGLRVRQTPGLWNALGLVKFIMPNSQNIYLHDTPGKTAFERMKRDLSHGCVRLSDPKALAVRVLRDQHEWTESTVLEAMDGEDNHRVNLKAPIPVCIIYATAIARENGEVLFYEDIYGLDRELETLLTKGYPYPL